MQKVYVGCNELQHDWAHYFERLNSIELDLSTYREMPKESTLNRWRVESPRGFSFVLHTDSRLGPTLAKAGSASSVEQDSAFWDAWRTYEQRAEALAAKALLIKTPQELTPGDEGRDKLRVFAEKAQNISDRLILWEPQGLWTVPQVRDIASELGLTPIYDPYVAHREGHGFTHGDAGFALAERAGARRRFDVFDFERLLDWTSSYDRIFVMLRGRNKWTHARQFRAALRRSGHLAEQPELNDAADL
jgi:hypothetical protein